MENKSSPEIPKEKQHLNASRKDFQLPRRLIHLSMGTIVALVYIFFLNHQSVVYILGTVLCVLYIFEQVRINYPEHAAKMAIISKYFYRAEEQLKESAGIPFIMGILLTILTFPKHIAIIAIFTLAISDPLSAIIGIKYGKFRIVKEKSLEGSLAFFLSSFIIVASVLASQSDHSTLSIFFLSLFVALSTSFFEMLPIKLDDNLTIPLFTAMLARIGEFLFF